VAVASREEIEAVLPKLGRGARINLKLKEGGEVPGTLYGVFDGLVHFEEEEIEPVDLDLIDNLLVRIHTEGPGTDILGQQG
jgi:hypothetical protein